MIAWLRERLALAPDGIHAVIVPDLDANRGSLERVLAAALQPELELPGTGSEQRVFDLAGGHPLAVQPVVDAALAAVACAAGAVDWATASRLLLSSHVAGAASERNARIAADLSLREAQGSVRVHGLRLADRALKAGAAQFASPLAAAAAPLVGAKRRGAGAWAEAFGACLAAWGWPGEAPLGSREFQAARRFRELLRELASLSAVAADLSAAEAMAELRRLAAAPFQPESGEPAVFVLDAYDDPGVHFDSLWVAGLTAPAWPRAVSVDPLLPIEIQRELGMPGVTPESCVAEAQAIIASWRAGADALVLSSPQFENDTEVDETPLLPAAATELAVPASPPTRERLAFDAASFEPVLEAPMPPLATGHVKGGARLLELQAKCAFRAFGELRLGASPHEEPQAGFDRRLRGIVLHRALQSLWDRLGSQDALAALDATTRSTWWRKPWTRRSATRRRRARVLSPPHSSANGSAVPSSGCWPSILRARRSRSSRPSARTRWRLAGIELRLRVDRVDRIGDELVVIDYKTGRAAGSAWRGARMDAPQLPLYAVLHPDHPTGIAFAGVGAAGAKYVGVGRDGSAIDGIEPAEKFKLTEDRQKGFPWAEITSHWRAWLERLAGDFAAGRAEVDPKLAALTCRHCHLAALCRVEAASPEDAEEDVIDGE